MTRIVSFAVSCLLWLAAAALLVPAAHLLHPSTVSLDGDQRQYLSFIATFAERSRSKNGRMPSQAEYLSWFQSREVKGLASGGPEYAYSSSNFPSEAIAQFGAPPPDAYTVSFWNRDAVVVTASSWQPDPSIAVVNDSNYLFDNRLVELLTVLLAFACLVAANLALLRYANRARANPSVKGTSCGKPQAAPYLER